MVRELGGKLSMLNRRCRRLTIYLGLNLMCNRCWASTLGKLKLWSYENISKWVGRVANINSPWYPLEI